MSFVQNTQSKIFNEVRRTYLDKSDLEEGQEFCSNCLGTGKEPGTKNIFNCGKCQGFGILDWVEKVVGKPPVLTGMYSSSGINGLQGINGPQGISGTSGAAKVTNI